MAKEGKIVIPENSTSKQKADETDSEAKQSVESPPADPPSKFASWLTKEERNKLEEDERLYSREVAVLQKYSRVLSFDLPGLPNTSTQNYSVQNEVIKRGAGAPLKPLSKKIRDLYYENEAEYSKSLATREKRYDLGVEMSVKLGLTKGDEKPDPAVFGFLCKRRFEVSVGSPLCEERVLRPR